MSRSTAEKEKATAKFRTMLTAYEVRSAEQQPVKPVAEASWTDTVHDSVRLKAVLAPACRSCVTRRRGRNTTAAAALRERSRADG